MRRFVFILLLILLSVSLLTAAQSKKMIDECDRSFKWSNSTTLNKTAPFFQRFKRYSDEDGSDVQDDPISSEKDEDNSSSSSSSSSNSSSYDSGSNSGYSGDWSWLALLFANPATALVTASVIMFITAAATPPLLAVAVAQLSEYLKTGFPEQQEYATGTWAAFGACFSLAIIPWIIVNVKYYDGTPLIPALTMTYYTITFFVGSIASSVMLNLQYTYSNTPLYFETASTACGWGLTALFLSLATTLFILTGRANMYSRRNKDRKFTVEPDMMGLRIRF